MAAINLKIYGAAPKHPFDPDVFRHDERKAALAAYETKRVVSNAALQGIVGFHIRSLQSSPCANLLLAHPRCVLRNVMLAIAERNVLEARFGRCKKAEVRRGQGTMQAMWPFCMLTCHAAPEAVQECI